MAVKVGPKGQIVIDKAIRDRLNVQPGWLALQLLVDDHVEIRFIPPEHDESLAGCLAAHTNAMVTEGEEWDRAREQAGAAMAREWLDSQDAHE